MLKSKKDLACEQFRAMADRLGQAPAFLALLQDDDSSETHVARTEQLDAMIRIHANEMHYLLPSVNVSEDFCSRLCKTPNDKLSPPALHLKRSF